MVWWHRSPLACFSRALLAGGLSVAVALTGLIGGTPPAHADASTTAAEYAFVRLLNRDRMANGLAPLGVFEPLVPTAESWSAQMAAAGALSHDPNIKAEYTQVASPFSGGGENVGEGSGTEANPVAIHNMFMASPVHHANIMGAWQYVAVGVVKDASGSLWVTERFLASPPKPATSEVPIARLSGSTDGDTGVAVSKFVYPNADSAQAVVLGRNDVFADALAGGPLAVADGGPLLLTDPGSLTPSVLSEIQRVLPGGGPVHILGGTGAVSPAVESSLQGAGFKTDRLAGADRFATAVAVAKAMGYSGGPAFLASGYSFADALVAGPAAGVLKAPIFLTDGSALSSATGAALQGTPPSSLTAVGGTAVISDGVASAAGVTKRLGGADRYETSTLVAAAFFPNATEVAFANGMTWQDALVGAPASARLGAPTLLLANPAAAGSTFDYVAAHASGQGQLFAYGTPDVTAQSPLTELYGG